MAHIDDFAKRMRDARRERGLTQHELARRLDVSQSAVSQFESGVGSALGLESRAQAAEVLGIPLAPAFIPDEAPALRLAYCSEPECPMNVPYLVGDEIHIQPTMIPLAGRNARRCAGCGGKLGLECPGECGQPLEEGGHCTHCGSAFVTPPPVPGDKRRWVDRARDRIGELRRMTGTLRRRNREDEGNADDGQEVERAETETPPRRARSDR